MSEKQVLVVFTNAVEGRHTEFNRWYDEVHLRDVISVDGFVAAQRFRLAKPQIMDDRSYEYMAIYELEADDLQKTFDALRANSSNLVISDSMAEGAAAWAFTPITERIT